VFHALRKEATNTKQWLKMAQEIMSSTASNYDIKKLFMGAGFAALALILATFAASPTIFASLKVCYPIIAITLLYGIMMFASSYVEEEQHFWYWATTGWLALLWIRSYVFL
jgi:ethanolamine phosphate transferase 2 subunit G